MCGPSPEKLRGKIIIGEWKWPRPLEKPFFWPPNYVIREKWQRHLSRKNRMGQRRIFFLRKRDGLHLVWVQSVLHPPNNSRDRSAIPKNDRWLADRILLWINMNIMYVVYKWILTLKAIFCFRNLKNFSSCPCIQWGTFWAANSAGNGKRHCLFF